MNTKNIGDRSEAMVLAKFIQLNWIVLKPFGDNQRYDLVIDRGSGFERVQVKTARYRNGSVIFSTSSSYAHRGRSRLGYKGQCELFAAYCDFLNKVYLLPVSELGESMVTLRCEPTKNKQVSGVRIAKNYEI